LAWQYHKKEANVLKRLLPVKKSLAMDISGENLSLLTSNLRIYQISVPFIQEKAETCGSSVNNEGMSHSDIVQEILRNAKELQKVNQVRIEQEELKEQMEIAEELLELKDEKLFECRCSIRISTFLAEEKLFEWMTELTYRSKFTLKGNYWKISIKI
jgi:vacuolar-type H+-ATPase catalytic subunit A/Vma1